MPSAPDLPVDRPIQGRRLAQNTALLLAGNFSQAGLGLLTGVILARYLGTVGFGQYAFVMTTVSVFGLFVELGFNTFLTRDVARDRRRVRRYLTGSLAAKFGLSVLTAIPYAFLVWGLWGHRDGQVMAAMLSGPALFLLIAFNASLTSMFRAFEAMDDLLILNLVAVVGQLTGLFILAVTGYGVAALVWWVMCVQAGRLGMSWWLLRRLIGWQRGDAHEDAESGLSSLARLSLELIKGAWPFGLATIAITLYARVDILLLSFLAGDRVVGQYSAVYRFLDALRMPPGAFQGAYLPALSRAGAGGSRADLVHSFRSTRRWLLVYGIGSALLVTLFAPILVRVLYTGRFESSIPVLQVLIWALVPLVADDAALTYLYAVGRERVVQIVMAIGLVINLGLNLWMIPRYGALGAAITTIASESVLFLILWRQITHHDHPV